MWANWGNSGHYGLFKKHSQKACMACLAQQCINLTNNINVFSTCQQLLSIELKVGELFWIILLNVSGFTHVGNSGQFLQDFRCPEFPTTMCFYQFSIFLLDLDRHTLGPLAYKDVTNSYNF